LITYYGELEEGETERNKHPNNRLCLAANQGFSLQLLIRADSERLIQKEIV